MTRGNGKERAIEGRVHREPATRASGRAVLITGGAGFIGCNLAHRLLTEGREVVLLDNLSRPGVERNARWLRDTHGDAVRLLVADIRDRDSLASAAARASEVYHFAAQVAVTTSLEDPVADFDVNARGTLNLLEVLRALPEPPPLLYTSTNKVYGALADLPLMRRGERYEPRDGTVRAHGVSEERPLDFHSPYGCSKGTADQYVLDYARSFGFRAIVFRMSCIYGPHQCGTEDQGWVAHFLRCAIAGQPITLYGDGRQVRDILFIDDLVDAFLLAQRHMATHSGRAFNIGGGPANTVSLLELLELMEGTHGRRIRSTHEEWRTGDQRYYVSDTRAFQEATGWRPRVGVREGIERLYEWLLDAYRPARAAATVKRPTAAANLVPGARRAADPLAGGEEVA
jgi:CDP-paratose 2-epimerase